MNGFDAKLVVLQIRLSSIYTLNAMNNSPRLLAKAYLAAQLHESRKKDHLVYLESEDGSFSPTIADECDKFIQALILAGLSPSDIRKKLRLTRKRLPKKFHTPLPGREPIDPAKLAEQRFVQRMIQLGVERDSGGSVDSAEIWQSFPETPEYLERSLERFERELEVQRLNRLRIEEAERSATLPPQHHSAASAAEILGKRPH